MQYNNYVELSHDYKIKTLQSDGGREYIDDEFQAILRENVLVHGKTV